MSRKKIAVIVAIAFMIGVIVTLSALLIFRKHEMSADGNIDNTDYMGIAVVDGFAIPIPNQYMAMVDPEIGLSYADNKTFEMEISGVGWFRLMKPFDELAVDGNSYIYCVYEDEGEIVLLAYKEADTEHVFEIMVRCLGIDRMKYQTEEELIREYESYILIADSMLRGAKPTDEEDTPAGTTYVAAEMYTDLQVVVTETFVSQDALYDEADRMLVSYQISDNFYLMAQEIKPGNYSAKVNQETERDIIVTVVGGHRHSDMDVQKVMAEGAAIWADAGAEVKSIEINGKIVYYYSYTEKYQAMDETCEKYYFEAATDMKNGTIYRVSARSEVSPDALDIDTYVKFLTIEEP